MVRHESKVRVRYAETDQMGVVYHSHFLPYFEVARAEMIREAGYSYKNMEANGVVMPVTEVNIRYLRPARYDDLLSLRSVIRELPEKRLIVETTVYNEAEERLVVGTVTLAFFDVRQKRTVPCPPDFLAILQAHWDSKDSKERSSTGSDG